MDIRINAFVLLSFFILLTINCFIFTVQSADCVYRIQVKTGDVSNAGTDSKITLSLFNNKLKTITVSNLESSGVMDPKHDYFERGNLDVFLVTDTCLTSPVCGLILKSDNTGDKPGWYVDYVDVTTYSVPQKSIEFDVSQWLALDEYPKELTTIRNLCGQKTHPNENMPLSFLENIVV